MSTMTPEYHRQWRKDNPDKVKAAAQKWRQNNLDKAREASRRWNRSHPDIMRAKRISWGKTLKGRYSTLLSSAKIMGRTVELSFQDWEAIASRPCFYCDGVALSPTGGYGIDRIDSKFGYTMANSVACCPLCNQMKSDLPQATFISQVKRIGRCL